MLEEGIRDFVSTHAQSEKKFTDKDFPPDKSSLYNARQDELTPSEIQWYETLQWKRLSEIYPG